MSGEKGKVTVLTLAGNPGSAGYADATGTTARFHHPASIVSDGDHLYVADSKNHTIRRIVISNGDASTFAGKSKKSGFSDGRADLARFNRPFAVTLDRSGSTLYVADSWNHAIRKVVISTGEVLTLAGLGASGAKDGTGNTAHFDSPYGIAIDSASLNLYIADSGNHTIRRIKIATGEVTTLAGSPRITGATDGRGEAASFHTPFGLTLDETGAYLFVSDSENHIIRKIVVEAGEVTTLAGIPGLPGSDDGEARHAKFNGPRGIARDMINHYLYVSDFYNHAIRRIEITTGIVTTIAGSPSTATTCDGEGPGVFFNGPTGIAADFKYIYVTDINENVVRMIKP